MLLDILIVLAVALEAYLLGSIDTGILVSRFVYHDDVRRHGSGAAGMTNMLRTFGKKAAAMTAAGDVLKGVLAVCIGRWLFGFMSGELFSQYLGVYLAAILAVIGHLKPIYFGFKGGKGVLVAGGAILAVQPILLPFLVVIFLICLIPTGMVSLGSIVMAVCYPFLTLGYGLVRDDLLHAPLQPPAHPRRQGVPLRQKRQGQQRYQKLSLNSHRNTRPPPGTAGAFVVGEVLCERAKRFNVSEEELS